MQRYDVIEIGPDEVVGQVQMGPAQIEQLLRLTRSDELPDAVVALGSLPGVQLLDPAHPQDVGVWLRPCS